MPKLVQQTCTCWRKTIFSRNISCSRWSPTLNLARIVVYWIHRTGFLFCSKHKHNGWSFENEGASSVGGSQMPLYMKIAHIASIRPIEGGRLLFQGENERERRRSWCREGNDVLGFMYCLCFFLEITSKCFFLKDLKKAAFDLLSRVRGCIVLTSYHKTHLAIQNRQVL